MSTVSPQLDPARPPKRKHWFRRIVITVAILLALLALAVQIVLWTDLPRGIVVGQIEKQLGLRLTVKSLSTGWLGHTTLTDVTIGLPLADKAFLEVPVMKVKNTSLIGLMLGRSVEVTRIELDRPHLHVTQDSDGTWNLAEVAELVARAGGKKPGEESAQSSSPAMPDLHLAGGIITISDNTNRSVDIEPLSIDGYHDSGVTWKYDIDIPPRLHITGRLVPGGNWGHELAVKVQNVGAWAKPWSADFPELGIDVAWRGALSDAGLGGRLDVRRVTLGLGAKTIGARGALTAAMGGDLFTIRPDNLVIDLNRDALPQFKLASGLISFNTKSKDVKLDHLIVALFGGTSKISADYNINTNGGKLDAAWEKLSLPGGITHSGNFTATLRQPFPDKINLDAKLNSSGKMASGAWTTSIIMGLAGKSFADCDWNIHFDKLLWQRHKVGFQLDGLALAGGLHDRVMAMNTISLPNRDLISGNLSYALAGAHPWSIHMQGQHWPIHHLQDTELAFELAAHGDDKAVAIDSSFLKTPDAKLTVKAGYVFNTPKPLNVELWIDNALPTQVPAAIAANTPAKILNGTIDGHFALTGTFDPLQLEASGSLNGREIEVRGYHLGDITLALSKESHVDRDGVFVGIESVLLFDGRFGIAGAYDFNTDDVRMTVNFDKISLGKLAAIAGQNDISGTAEGTIVASLPWFTPDLNHLVVSPATITMHDVKAPQVDVDQINATLSLSDGNLQIDPILLRRGDGRGELRVAMNLNDPRRINLATTLKTWPIDMPGAEARMNASVDIPEFLIELPDSTSPDPGRHQLRATARQITVRAAATWKGDKLADLIAYAGINGRELDVRGVHLQMLGGRMDGQMHAHLDRLGAATAEFTWERVDVKKLALIYPPIKEFSGELSGGLRVAPSTVPRPREPSALVLTTQFKNGAWRTLPIQDLRIAAYFGRQLEEGEEGWRIVLDDGAVDPSFIHMGGGTVELWGRFGIHGRASSSQALINFRELDLNQFIHALEPKASYMPGKVAGSMTLLRTPTPPARSPPIALDRMFPSRPVIAVPATPGSSPHDPPLKQLFDPIFGEGRVTLTQSNLANFGPFAALYNGAHLFQDVKELKGYGNVEFRVERGTLTIDRMRYFNRGTEILAVATVKRLWQVPDSPVDGVASLTARPLAGIKMPIFADIDQAFSAIQQGVGLTAVRIIGRVGEPTPVPLSISELGADMRNFLVGDAKGAKGAAGD